MAYEVMICFLLALVCCACICFIHLLLFVRLQFKFSWDRWRNPFMFAVLAGSSHSFLIVRISKGVLSCGFLASLLSQFGRLRACIFEREHAKQPSSRTGAR
jgi:hypothetical protein